MKKTESVDFKRGSEIKELVEKIAANEDRTESMQLLRIVRELTMPVIHKKRKELRSCYFV